MTKYDTELQSELEEIEARFAHIDRGIRRAVAALAVETTLALAVVGYLFLTSQGWL